MLPDWRKECLVRHRDWLVPRFYDPLKDRFAVSVHSWLLRTPRHTILIDTCAGNAKRRPTYRLLNELDTPYLSRLRAAGVEVSDVDYVICTHFHVDHVGWNTRLVEGRWRPTFPNAVYLFPRLEREAMDPAYGIAKESSPEHAVYLDSILPILESGQAQFVEGDERIVDGMELMPARGHSRGQIAVLARSRAEQALFVGDVMHHPLQVFFPDWNSNLCEDAAMARETRLRILRYCAQHGSLLLPAHFAQPHYGQVGGAAGGFQFLPGTEEV